MQYKLSDNNFINGYTKTVVRFCVSCAVQTNIAPPTP